MPVYTFKCGNCGHTFKDLVSEKERQVTCPSCKSTQVEQQASKRKVVVPIGPTTSAPGG